MGRGWRWTCLEKASEPLPQEVFISISEAGNRTIVHTSGLMLEAGGLGPAPPMGRRRRKQRYRSPGKALTNLLRYQYTGYIDVRTLQADHRRLNRWSTEQIENSVLHSQHRCGPRFRWRRQMGRLYVSLSPHLTTSRKGLGPSPESADSEATFAPGLPSSAAGAHGTGEPVALGSGDRGDMSLRTLYDPKSPSSESPSGVALPTGWSRHNDAESGLNYFFNSVSRLTQWEHPLFTSGSDDTFVDDSSVDRISPQRGAGVDTLPLQAGPVVIDDSLMMGSDQQGGSAQSSSGGVLPLKRSRHNKISDQFKHAVTGSEDLLGKEAATSKERRKAREERALAAVPKK